MIDGQRVIDFHGHVGRWEYYGGDDDLSAYLRAMNAAGVDLSVVFEIWEPAGRPANEHLAQLIAPYRDRFMGFAYVSPLCRDTIDQVLTHAIDTLGLCGIKLYPPFVEKGLDDPCWEPIYAFANDRGLPIISHTDPRPHSQPANWQSVAGRYPNATFICAHTGNMEPARSQAIRLAQDHPNVMLETASSYRTPGVIEQLVRTVGPQRVLYGSDIPLMDPRFQIGKVLTADIPDSAKRLIIGGNAERLLGL